MFKFLLLTTLFFSQASFASDSQGYEVDPSIVAEITEGKIQAAETAMILDKSEQAWTLVFTSVFKIALVKDGNFQQAIVDELNIIIDNIEVLSLDRPEEALSVLNQSISRLQEMVKDIENKISEQNK